MLTNEQSPFVLFPGNFQVHYQLQVRQGLVPPPFSCYWESQEIINLTHFTSLSVLNSAQKMMVPFEKQYWNLKVNYLAKTLTASRFHKIYSEYSSLIWARDCSVFKHSAVYSPLHYRCSSQNSKNHFFWNKFLTSKNVIIADVPAVGKAVDGGFQQCTALSSSAFAFLHLSNHIHKYHSTIILYHLQLFFKSVSFWSNRTLRVQ